MVGGNKEAIDMTIELVKMIKSVQAGRECWEAGEIYPKNPGDPLHPVLLAEIMAKTGTVEVLSHKKDSVPEKSGLIKPLSDNTLAEAQHKEREATEALRLATEKAEQLLIEKREMLKTVEDLQLSFEALQTMVYGFQRDLQELKEAPVYTAEESIDLLSERITALENAGPIIDAPEPETKKQDAPSKKTSGKKVSGKKKLIVRRK